MPTEKRVPSLIVNTLAQAQYEALENPSDTEMWVTPYDESILPDQTGQSGKYLTTNGSNASWATVDTLPSQTGQNGKFLTTDGTDASWATVNALPSQTGQSGKYLTTDGSAASWAAIPATISADGTTIENNSNVLTTIGVKDQNTSNAIKTWTGTKAQYDAIVTKDADTIYTTTDEAGDSTEFADTSLSNLTNAGKIVGAGLGMPSSTYDDLTLGASGTKYTAPANGWFMIEKRTNSNSSQYMNMNNLTNGFSQEENATVSGNNLSLFIPVKKGDVVRIGYNADGITEFFRFYYAEGSKSEAN